MWGSIMNRATALAADLDKQLNESVGIDAESSTSTPAPKPAAIASENTAITEGNIHANGVADAWNDDFDFDDDYDEERGEVKEAPPSTAVEEELKQEEIPPPVPDDPSSAEKAADSAEELDAPALSPSATYLAASEDAQASGWEAEDDLDLIENDGDQNEFNATEPTLVDKPITAEISEEKASNDVASPPEPETADAPTLPKEESPPPSPKTFEDEPTKAPSPPPKEESASKPSSPSREQATVFASNMFSTFADRAGSLAHQAESLMNGPGQVLPDDGGTETDAAMASKNSGVSSFFSSFPLGGTLSSHEKTDQYAAGMEESANEWAGEGDQLDLEMDDEAEAAISESKEPQESFLEEEGEGEGMSQVEESPSPIEEATAAPRAAQLRKFVPLEGDKDEPVMVELESQSMLSTENTDPVETASAPIPTVAAPAPTVAALATNIEDDPRYQKLVKELRLREEQLSSKSMQMTEMQDLMDHQERELKQKVADTKEEAKKRILRSKERFEAAEAKVKELQSSNSADSESQTKLIQALREEGDKLAQKQSAMEQAVRAAKIECRDLQEQLETEKDAKAKGQEKIAKLESDLKSTKELLTAARKGESQAGKLEQDLLSVRSDAETKANTILSLQQQAKEMTAEKKELQEELKRTRKEAQQAAQQEKKSLRREHNDTISDLEAKLRTTEREAGVREDALRHEVSELRKRWQDAVRRADALSMDAQSSTAPLLRQLESMERQNRARAQNWTELENRLRSELEEKETQNQTLSKERSEFKSKYTRLERSMSDQEQELKQAKHTIEDQTDKITKLESQLEEMEAQAQKREEEYSRVERLANEGVMKVRSEMTQTVVDSEERYRGQIEKLENDLQVEHEKRGQLEKQVQELLENAGMIVTPQAPEAMHRESKPKKLRQAEGQAQILAGALGYDSDTDEDDEERMGNPMDRGEGGSSSGGGMNSFAALEHLSSKLKAAKMELESLRSNLRESERVRESLVEELGEARTAKEKLPFFEAKVDELTKDNREKELEIQALKEDIADVRDMYRTQLNVLLEEKASQNAPMSNGSSSQPKEQDASSEEEQSSHNPS